ncbi:hypothetical protein FPZ12_009150 [Amycolatopsis acidicola]|uniref:Mce-associated membrane protein n=1 Tax=Amycolatopsis acidicola TaxID=2596893 RepID=A0A5N0VBB2_9PSEU|nr:hypothetical protein [Amycolatopsis acidicola]KAA9163656.1 hypothetical protein FPZ12_009150 [Amycolatopsis acidicola]
MTVEETTLDDEPGVAKKKERPDSWRPSPRPRKWSVRHGRGLVWTFLVSVVLIVALAAAGGVLWYVRAQHDHQQRDAAITVAAREEVLALLSLDPATVQASLDRVLRGATGGWRQEFARNADQFTQVVHNGQVRAQATIGASAIQNAADDRATVLVSANAVIANSDSPQGYPAVYRVLMSLENSGGSWLVSDLQFVA